MKTVNIDCPAALFEGFPKMARLSRECVITEKQGLHPSAISPYCVYGYNEKEKGSDKGSKRSCQNPPTKVGCKKQGKTQRISESLSRSQVCNRWQVEGRGGKGGRPKGVDGRTKIKALHGLRRMLPGLLHGLRPPQWRQESPQHRQHVCAPLQPRTYSDRVGQMRLGLCQLP